jgi:hypothetical protein
LFKIFDGRKMPTRTSREFVACGNDAIRDLGISLMLFAIAVTVYAVICTYTDCVRTLWPRRP